MQEINFQLDIDLEKSLGESKNDRRIIFGLASTPDWDTAGERILQKGIDPSYFLNFGFFNYDHMKTPDAIIGYPFKDQVFVDDKGFHIAGELFKGVKYADDIWNLITVMKKSNSPRSLAFSVQGLIKEYDEDGKTITKALLTEVAVTPRPANPNARLDALVKSLAAGYTVDPAQMTDGMSALKREFLEGGLKIVLDRRNDVIKGLTDKGNLSREEAFLYFALTNESLIKILDHYSS